MSYNPKRPYLIIPKLIEQPTWGGSYILELKDWLNRPQVKNKKIGQSYELFGGSKLTLSITDSRDFRFIPEIGSADSSNTEAFELKETIDYITLAELVKNHAEQILGPEINKKYHLMPLLIKINQAYGNSFQLHIKPSEQHPRWKSKPESWYYLEDGLLTCGINPETNIEDYKKTCQAIEGKMAQLSALIQSGNMTLESAKAEAKEYIRHHNPWQYVNTHEAKKYDLIDLSAGGVHHSWEEDRNRYPLGNIVYEVQMDVMDPICTIRSFDQGKFKADGSIREIHIDDYFTYLDTDPQHNDINNLKKQREGNNLLTTPYYSLDILELADTFTDQTNQSFCHLYVRDGDVKVKAGHGAVRLTKGFSCFIPQAVGEYEIIPTVPDSVVLKTFIKL